MEKFLFSLETYSQKYHYYIEAEMIWKRIYARFQTVGEYWNTKPRTTTRSRMLTTKDKASWRAASELTS